SFVPMSLGVAASGFRKHLPETLPSQADEIVQTLNTLYKPVDAAQEHAAVVAVETRKAQEAELMRDTFAKVLGEVLAAQIGRQTMSIQASTANTSGDIVKSLARAMEQPLSQMVKAAETSAKHAESMERTLKEATAAMTRDITQAIAKTFE